MSLIENVKQRRESMGRLEVEVPEWECTLYFRPFSGDDHRKLSSFTKNGQDAAFYAAFLERKAENEDGSQAFEKGDREMLIRIGEYDLLMQIVTSVYQWTPRDLDPEASSQAQNSTSG